MGEKVLEKVTEQTFLDFLLKADNVKLFVIGIVIIVLGVLYLKYTSLIQKSNKDNSETMGKVADSLNGLGNKLTELNVANVEKDKKYVNLIENSDSKLDKIYDKVDELNINMVKHNASRCNSITEISSNKKAE